MENRIIKIQLDPRTLIKRHKEKITKAFKEIENFDDLAFADQFLALGHIKILCTFCAEDMLRAQTKLALEEKQ
jgi:hypothetical protein